MHSAAADLIALLAREGACIKISRLAQEMLPQDVISNMIMSHATRPFHWELFAGVVNGPERQVQELQELLAWTEEHSL